MPERQSQEGQGRATPLRSHWRPRTGAGLFAVVTFLVLMAFAQPPAVYLLANKIQPVVFGMPYLYVYLSVAYIGMIVVLLWSLRRGL